MFFINPNGNGVEMSFWNGCFASKVIGASVFLRKHQLCLTIQLHENNGFCKMYSNFEWASY